MALQKQSVDITFGEGLQEGVGDRLLDAPKVLDLEDARFSKRGQLAKRSGTTSTGASGLTPRQTGQAVWAFGDTLVQSGSEGPHVYDPLEGTWRRTNIAGPRPCDLRVDPVARGNGFYQHADIAYSSADNLACIAYEDSTERAIRVAFYDTSTGERLRDDRLEIAEMNQRPRVVFFNSAFVVFAQTASGNHIYAADYDVTAGDYDFGAAGVLVVTGTPSDVDFDVHAYNASQTRCYLVVAKGTSGWTLHQVDSFGTVHVSYAANTGRTARSAAVFHNPDYSGGAKVYVLYPDLATTPNQLSIDTMPADLLTPPTKTKVLDFTSTVSNDWRVTLGLGGLGATLGILLCVCSHQTCDGDETGGIDYNTVSGDGATAGSFVGFLPNLTLINKIQNDSLGRAVFGVTRDVDFDVAGSGVAANEEPLPAAFLLTPVSYSTTDYGATSQGVTYFVEPSVVNGMAPIARYGHDRVHMSRNSGQVYATFLGSQVLVGTELWGCFTILDDSNPGMSELQAHGWKLGVDMYRADCDPRGQQTTDVEGGVLVAGGVNASYDGRRLVEATCPVVPHRIETGAALSASCVGAEASDYVGSHGMTVGVDQYISAFALVRYAFRWHDSQGNLHRSTVSATEDFEYLDDTSAVSPMSRSPLSGGNRIYVFPRPSFTSLTGEHGIRYQVELYRTGFEYKRWDASPVTDTLLETVTDSDASTYKLVAIREIGEVTGHPNLGYIEDPAQSLALFPDDDAPPPYDTGGELASEPPPAALDIASTQRRVFLLSSEDRLSIWYSKPLIDGLAPEYHNSQQIRVSAEGGEVVAIAPLDDKLVIFKRGRVYAMPVTTGPNANGAGSGFMQPREVASDTGCTNRRSVVAGPFGVAFQSDRGLYLVGRDLGLTFLGEAVTDSLGALTIRSGVLIPKENEVRWSLSDGSALHWNYLKTQWSVAADLPAQSATRWLGEHAMMQSDGSVVTSAEGTYSGITSRPLLSVTTSWAKLAGLQGFQRIWNALLLLQHTTGALRIEVGYDYETTWTDTHDFTEAQLTALGTPTQVRIKPTRQKCQAIRFRISETDPSGDSRTLTDGTARTMTDGTTRTLTYTTGGPTIGAGFEIDGLRLEVGLRAGSFKFLGSSAKR